MAVVARGCHGEEGVGSRGGEAEAALVLEELSAGVFRWCRGIVVLLLTFFFLCSWFLEGKDLKYEWIP